MKNEKYVVFTRNRYRWRTTPKMRDAGFVSLELGTDQHEANRKAQKLNIEWDTHLKEQKTNIFITKRGDFNWLVDKFQKDNDWYGNRALTTRQDMDRAFFRVCAKVGKMAVADFNFQHARGMYAEFREEITTSASEKAMKWLRRLLKYAREVGVIKYIPIEEMEIAHANDRDQTWTADEVKAVIVSALYGGMETDLVPVNEPPIIVDKIKELHDQGKKFWRIAAIMHTQGYASQSNGKITAALVRAVLTNKPMEAHTSKSGNAVRPRRSIALATAIAYDTSLPQGDILRLTWSQWDGQGFEVLQQKRRGRKNYQKKIYVIVSPETRDMLEGTLKSQPHIIVSEDTGQPYLDAPNSSAHSQRTTFGRLFAKFRKRAGVDGRTFHDLRRSAMTAMGNSGATNAEIVSFSGHSITSPVVGTYVRPDKATARNAANKRWKDK